MKGNILFSANSTLRHRYGLRTAGTPTEGNRTFLNISVCLLLLTAMAVATFNMEYSDAVVKSALHVPVPFMTRHIMGMFMILMFLLVDGSPESLSLGMALGCEAVARSIDYHFLTPAYSNFSQHFLFQMGDILRLYFATQMARVSSKKSGPWLLYGTILSIPYGLAMEFSPWFASTVSNDVRNGRDIVIGFVGAWICARVAIAISKDKLPWRVLALIVAAIAFAADPLNICTSRLASAETALMFAGFFEFYRYIAYFLYSLAAFFNISTLENRVRALSVARIEEQVAKVREEQRVHEAIAKTTQMLAHDVRKPFSLLSAYMDLVANTNSPEETSKVFSRMVPDVKKSLRLVDQLLTDVMDIGRESKPLPKSLSVQKALSVVIENVFRTTRNTNIHFHYRFRHQGNIWVDEQHLQRILSNILDNAEQAIMGRSESITITTSNFSSEIGARICVEIHNTGSCIASEYIDSVFEAFFTKNKRGGTGLGLAIVKKLVEANDGNVSVVSNLATGTSFRFSFPCTPAAAADRIPLPSCSADVQLNFGDDPQTLVRRRDSSSQGVRPSGASHFRILVVDDDPVYSESVRLHVHKILGDRMTLAIAQSYEEGLRRMAEGPIDILICDYDLASKTNDGIDLINEIKKENRNCTAVLHTNHLLTDAMTLRLGGNLSKLLRKPMVQDQFEQLVKDFNSSRLTSLGKPAIAIVEDDLIFAELITIRLPQFEVTIYESPSQFLLACHENSQLLSSFTAVVTDLHFSDTSQTGFDLASALRDKSQVPLVLYTNAEIAEDHPNRKIFEFVSKKSGNDLVKFLTSLAIAPSKSA